MPRLGALSDGQNLRRHSSMDDDDDQAPGISRKVTACVACRKQKIKCHMQNGHPPCTRCTRRGLSCTLNRSLQMILESDAAWKEATDSKLSRLEGSLLLVSQQLSVPSLPAPALSPPPAEASQSTSTSPLTQPSSSARLQSNGSHRPNSRWDVVLDPETGPAAIPASVVRVAEPHQMQTVTPHNIDQYDDLITRGVVSYENAQRYFDTYCLRLDHFLYRILGDESTLSGIRAKSSLLTAAIMTVGSLHAASEDFEACYEDFTASVSSVLFLRSNAAEEVRALLIGSFWLSGISWTLVGVGSFPIHFTLCSRGYVAGRALGKSTEAVLFSGRRCVWSDSWPVFCVCLQKNSRQKTPSRELLWVSSAAVRLATEISLHRSAFKAIQGDHAHYMRTRLYYLVYVCDHHFSIIYGRPPMTQQDESIRATAKFLASPHATEDDHRLVSQVEFWSVGTLGYQTFGTEIDKPLEDSVLPQLRTLTVDLDAWRARWSEKFRRNRHVGDYPRKGVALHTHFIKLYLLSHALRGMGNASTRSTEGTLELDELVCSAVLSATSLLRMVISDRDIHGYLNGLPTYFHIMIPFAAVFLLKVTRKHSELVGTSFVEASRLVKELAAVLKRISSAMHPQHLLVSVARGVESLLEHFPSHTEALALDREVNGAMSLHEEPIIPSQLFGLDNGWDSLDLMQDIDFLQEGLQGGLDSNGLQ